MKRTLCILLLTVLHICCCLNALAESESEAIIPNLGLKTGMGF